MMRYSVLAALSVVAASAVATQASEGKDNAVLISVSEVRLPNALPGVCQVNGVISEVLNGKAFREGQSVSLRVPCGSYTKPMPLLPAVETHGVQLIDPDVLKGSKLGGAHLDETGKLIWEPTRPYGRWGAIWGFRVFEGVPLNRGT